MVTVPDLVGRNVGRRPDAGGMLLVVWDSLVVRCLPLDAESWCTTFLPLDFLQIALVVLSDETSLLESPLRERLWRVDHGQRWHHVVSHLLVLHDGEWSH